MAEPPLFIGIRLDNFTNSFKEELFPVQPRAGNPSCSFLSRQLPWQASPLSFRNARRFRQFQQTRPSFLRLRPPPLPGGGTGTYRSLPWHAAALPRISCSAPCEGLGIGTALGILLYTAAFLMLRTDISRKEQWFLGVMAVLECHRCKPQSFPDSHYNLLVAMFLPLAIIFLPRKEGNGYVPGTRYTSWLEYRFFRMNQVRKAAQSLKENFLLPPASPSAYPCFSFFLSIFADGNPVVASVRTAMNELAVRYLSWLLPSREMFIHFLLWVLGSLSFGILTMHRRCPPFGEDRPIRPEKPWLPSLPVISPAVHQPGFPGQ